MNLVVNALEACQKGGEVRIGCVSDDDGCTITIADNGCGIPEELLPKLSQAFVSTKGSGGTGLGLACSYKIVREHGGDVQVESTLGQGSQFSVFLPHIPRVSRPTEQIRMTMEGKEQEQS
jgi:signal transduction histidine kinase